MFYKHLLLYPWTGETCGPLPLYPFSLALWRMHRNSSLSAQILHCICLEIYTDMP